MPLTVRCRMCGADTSFAQPHCYHAGFANQGFLDNDAGNRTLVWSSFDPAYEALVGHYHPWTHGPQSRARLEAALAPPVGDRWRFRNPPRCPACSHPIGLSPAEGEIRYLVYPGSVILDEPVGIDRFAEALADAPRAS